MWRLIMKRPVGFFELDPALVEERLLGISQSRQVVARSRWSSAHAGIAREDGCRGYDECARMI